MKTCPTFLCSLLVLAGLAASADAHWCVGVRIGVPLWFPGCYGYYPGYYYYAPRPRVCGATNRRDSTERRGAGDRGRARLLVARAGCSAVVRATVHSARTFAADFRRETDPARYAVSTTEPLRSVSVADLVQSLASPDEWVRLDGVTQLGRLKVLSAIDPLAATLAGDHSPAVREAAARALAFIGSPSAVPALTRAVQVDPDHNVRLSAAFALDVLGSR